MIISYRRTIGKVKCLRCDLITDLPKAIHQFGCCCNRNSGGLTPEARPPEFRELPDRDSTTYTSVFISFYEFINTVLRSPVASVRTKVFVRLRQKLFSNPCRASNSKRREHLRVRGVLIAARQGFELYEFSTPFGQIRSLRSQSDSKAFRIPRNSLPDYFLSGSS